ncbi:hypothetical protein [Agreia sp. COWG]|uniref:hypothetical protein n=1 Tax=Agreia sp. COWG TaxID=2773266 RepID=UPI001928FC04|nr:hypothetical protein [Agreia sp. COWG]CAD5989493.1 conserved protein of unknown function [Agreia sp. COWG]
MNAARPATTIDDVVRAVPGVRGVYPAVPELLRLPDAIVERVRGARDDATAPTVRIRIGIDDAESARVVCERVYVAVREHLGDADVGVRSSISVSVVAIG